MKRPTAEEIVEIKAECRRRFGHERVLGIPLGDPIDAYFVVAAFGMREAAEYVDARADSVLQAQSALVVDRCLWPDQKTIAVIRQRRGHLDAKIEEFFRPAMGFSPDNVLATAQRFSAMTAPPGFASPDMLAAKVLELQKAHPSAELWSITHRANGLALVVAAPEEAVSSAFTVAFGAMQQSKRGGLTLALTFMRDLVVWSPKPLDAYLEEAPGRAMDLANPLLEMGGAAATGSASFL